MAMNIKKLATEIARAEGKKTEARIGEIREILSIISDLVVGKEGADVLLALSENGKRRASRKAK